ncbi:MAG: hypothetical protein D6725_16780, partial [Planctomycetota bacterium]
LSREDNAEFQRRWRAIKNSYDIERAASDFERLCRDFESRAPTFVRGLLRKAGHYLVSLEYPDAIRRTPSTTNAVEAAGGELERLRRNSGGYFQSERITRIKIALTVRNLHDGRWSRPASNTCTALQELNRMFQERFEDDEP